MRRRRHGTRLVGMTDRHRRNRETPLSVALHIPWCCGPTVREARREEPCCRSGNRGVTRSPSPASRAIVGRTMQRPRWRQVHRWLTRRAPAAPTRPANRAGRRCAGAQHHGSTDADPRQAGHALRRITGRLHFSLLRKESASVHVGSNMIAYHAHRAVGSTVTTRLVPADQIDRAAIRNYRT